VVAAGKQPQVKAELPLQTEMVVLEVNGPHRLELITRAVVVVENLIPLEVRELVERAAVERAAQTPPMVLRELQTKAVGAVVAANLTAVVGSPVVMAALVLLWLGTQIHTVLLRQLLVRQRKQRLVAITTTPSHRLARSLGKGKRI
jgi:hypothetical protein